MFLKKLYTNNVRYLPGVLLLLAVILCCVLPVAGQEVAASQHVRDSLYRHISRELSAESAFRLNYPQGRSIILHNLGNNTRELRKLEEFIRIALHHPDLYVDHIYLTGYSSIEGPYYINDRLSRERVEQLYLYLSKLHPQILEYEHSISHVAEDWPGLRELVRESSLAERDEILNIIHRVPNYDERERLLRQLNGGAPFRHMYRHFFPLSRKVELRVEYRLTPKEMPAVSEPLVTEALPSKQPQPRRVGQSTIDLGFASPRRRKASERKTSRRHVSAAPAAAIKTNLLLLAGVQSDLDYTTPTPNLALEYFINPSWSVEVGAMYSYWHYNHNREFQGLSGYRLEPRYRFVVFRNRAPEMYLGVYGRFGDYDLRPEGVTGKYWDAGLSAGFFFPLWKGFGIEAGARAGYLKTNAVLYTHEEDNNWFDDRKGYNKIRVTDLNVSLIYRFRQK